MRPILLVLILLLPVAARAAMPPELQAKLETLAKESDGLAKQRAKWEGVQKALLEQKKDIDESQYTISQRQADLGQRSVAHNQKAGAQNAALKGSQDDCNNGGNNSSGHANECNTKIKDINQQTGDINADAAALKAEQDSLDAQYAKANQTASDWNLHERQAVKQLNAVYKGMNDWLDRAYDMVANPDFRDEITARGVDAVCENRGLPSGTLSIATMNRLSDYYRKCLKSVLAEQKKAAAAAPASQPK
ncbi:MAG TPA: hypothetical protein VHP13_05565 [Gammaproteobacteria bacterium]|jgi:hypothetical protein|nr:hypothetical protein [Gammaproteobacteria bacterium]